MTRKDYVLIAAAIRETLDARLGDNGDVNAIAATARAIANKLAADNPRFDLARFLIACGF